MNNCQHIASLLQCWPKKYLSILIQVSQSRESHGESSQTLYLDPASSASLLHRPWCVQQDNTRSSCRRLCCINDLPSCVHIPITNFHLSDFSRKLLSLETGPKLKQCEFHKQRSRVGSCPSRLSHPPSLGLIEHALTALLFQLEILLHTTLSAEQPLHWPSYRWSPYRLEHERLFHELHSHRP